MKQLPLLLSAAIFVASAAAQQKTTVPNTPTPSDHLAFVRDYMRAETGNTEAMLQLSYDYETGTRLLPRDLNRALYYALRAKRHGASIEKRELDTLLTKTIDAASQQAYPHWIRTSPDGMWQILMQRDETAAPGILFVTISQKVEQRELEDA
ncbi:SEL1-like repeat protein, partial [Akkermansia glycaniphila]